MVPNSYGGEDQEFLGGTETENGMTRTYDANWTVISKSADLTGGNYAAVTTAVVDGNIVEITGQDTDGNNIQFDIPDSFVAASGATLKNVRTWGEQGGDYSGSDTTYVDADGNVLGRNNAWSDSTGSGYGFEIGRAHV